MSLTARALAEEVGADLEGEGDRTLVGIAPLDEAGPDQVSFLTNDRYREKARASRAGAIIVGRGESDLRAPALLRSDNPYLTFAQTVRLFHPEAPWRPGVDARAVVEDDAAVDPMARVEAQAVVGAGSRVGARTWVGAGAVIGRDVTVGRDCRIHPNVVLYDGVTLGDRVILHAGVVVGSDGFGFARAGERYHKVPQVGTVVIEDDVELGANCTVDRGALGATLIGRGCKLDNLVQVGHNVRIGANSVLVAQTGIAGSVTIGEGATLAGQSGVSGHLALGRNVVVSGKCAVFKDLEDGAFVSGVPARPHRQWLRREAALNRLLDLRERVARLEQSIRKEEA